jgi:uncharacterized OB-fold protein
MKTIELPVCMDCGTVQYPVREVCVRCLSGRLQRKAVNACGALLACTRLHRSMDERFAPRLPLEIGSIQLDAGPVVIAILERASDPGMRMGVRVVEGPDGRSVMHADVAE